MSRARVTCLALHVHEVPVDSDIFDRSKKNPSRRISMEECLACLALQQQNLSQRAEQFDLAPLEEDRPNGFAVEYNSLGMKIKDVEQLYTSPTSQHYARIDD